MAKQAPRPVPVPVPTPAKAKPKPKQPSKWGLWLLCGSALLILLLGLGVARYRSLYHLYLLQSAVERFAPKSRLPSTH